MAQYDTLNTAGVGVRTAEIDAGLRAHMNKVYGLMSVAMVLTAGVAWAVGTNEAMIVAIYSSPLKWLVMFLPLAMVFGLSAMINRMSVAAAKA
jgi:FtsH-binding integral membrane protein